MPISIKLSSRKPAYAFGEQLQFRYSIENTGQQAIYAEHIEHPRLIVTAAPLVDIMMARMANDLLYFEFRPPTLVHLAPGGYTAGQFTIGMPPEDTTIGPDGVAANEEIKLYGDLEIVLKVGYLDTPFQPATSDPLGEFLAVQNIESSPPIPIRVAAP